MFSAQLGLHGFDHNLVHQRSDGASLDLDVEKKMGGRNMTDVTQILERLRGIVRIPITDGLGPVAGGSDSPTEYVRQYDMPPNYPMPNSPLSTAAISAIENQAARIAELEAALSADHHAACRKTIAAQEKRIAELEANLESARVVAAAFLRNPELN
jgi:hypothetical protein